MHHKRRSGINAESTASFLDFNFIFGTGFYCCFLEYDDLHNFEQALPDDCLPVDITEPGKLDEIFDLMDANSDGKVTFDEFKAAMQRDSSLQDVVLSSLRQ